MNDEHDNRDDDDEMLRRFVSRPRIDHLIGCRAAHATDIEQRNREAKRAEIVATATRQAYEWHWFDWIFIVGIIAMSPEVVLAWLLVSICVLALMPAWQIAGVYLAE